MWKLGKTDAYDLGNFSKAWRTTRRDFLGRWVIPDPGCSLSELQSSPSLRVGSDF